MLFRSAREEAGEEPPEGGQKKKILTTVCTSCRSSFFFFYSSAPSRSQAAIPPTRDRPAHPHSAGSKNVCSPIMHSANLAPQILVRFPARPRTCLRRRELSCICPGLPCQVHPERTFRDHLKAEYYQNDQLTTLRFLARSITAAARLGSYRESFHACQSFHKPTPVTPSIETNPEPTRDRKSVV